MLYRDIFEINPPLAFYLTAPAIWIADHTELTETDSYYLWVISLACISLIWTARIIQKASLESRSSSLLFAASIVALLVSPVSDFGQREHMMLVLALPYVWLLALYEEPKEVGLVERILLGSAAAIGLCLKPYFFLIPAFVILFEIARARRTQQAIRAENITVGLAALAYIAFIATVHPLYLESVVPIARSVYASFGNSPSYILLRPEMIAMIILIATALVLRRALDAMGMRVFLATVGAGTCFLIQFKGWNYQLIPVSGLLVLSSAILFERYFATQRKHPAAIASAVVILLFSLGHQISRGPYVPLTDGEFEKFVRADDENVLVLSSNVSAGFPFVNQSGLNWASRFPAQWLTPGAWTSHSRSCEARNATLCAEAKGILDLNRKMTIADLEKYQPDLVFIDGREVKSYFGGLPFDYIEYLSEDRKFKNIWVDYRKEGKVLDYHVWRRISIEDHDR